MPQIRAELGNFFAGGNSRLASEVSGLQVNLEIALSGVSAKVKPLNRV